MFNDRYFVRNIFIFLVILLLDTSIALAQYPFSGYSGYNPSYETGSSLTDWIWSNPWTAYDPGMGQVNVSFAPGTEWQSPYFQQQGYFGYPYGGYSQYQPGPGFSYPYSGYNHYQPYGYSFGYPYGGYNQYQPYGYSFGFPYGGYSWYQPYGYPYIPYGGGYPSSSFPSYLQWLNPWQAYDPIQNDILCL